MDSLKKLFPPALMGIMIGNVLLWFFISFEVVVISALSQILYHVSKSESKD